MFGSMEQPELMEGRRLVLELPMTLPATEALKALSDFMASYQGDKDALLFGYWDYGGALVITAPE